MPISVLNGIVVTPSILWTAVNFGTQGAGRMLIAPESASGVVSFRRIALNDLPSETVIISGSGIEENIPYLYSANQLTTTDDFKISPTTFTAKRNAVFGVTASGGTSSVKIGGTATGNRISHVDLIGDSTYSDYGFRIIRGNGGANALSSVVHRGTGELQIVAVEAGSLALYTTNALRMTIAADGRVGIGTAPASKLDVAGGYIRARDDGTNNPPSSGKGLEFLATGSQSYIISYDRGGSVAQPLNITSSYTDFSTADVRVSGTKVLQGRIAGWNAPTGTLTRGTFSASATLATTAQTLAALITDLRTHGLIGT